MNEEDNSQPRDAGDLYAGTGTKFYFWIANSTLCLPFFYIFTAIRMESYYPPSTGSHEHDTLLFMISIGASVLLPALIFFSPLAWSIKRQVYIGASMPAILWAIQWLLLMIPIWFEGAHGEYGFSFLSLLHAPLILIHFIGSFYYLNKNR